MERRATIPQVLTDPPWRRATAKPAPVVTTSAASTPAATLVWEPGEQATFRGKPPPRLTEVAEQRLFERLLDECDKRAPLRATEVGRLGDEKLAELADELDGSTTELATLKLLLGRLGDSIVAHAVTIVRSALRERGLFEAALPIRSSALAEPAASAFFERAIPASLDEPYTRTPVEAWVLRHPDAVVQGLADVARDATHPLHRAAQSTLAFVAMHGGLAGDAELAPYAALAPLTARGDAGWALLLATRNDPRAVPLVEKEPCAAAFVRMMQDARSERALAAVPDGIAELPAFFATATKAAPKLSDGTVLDGEPLRALGEMLRFSPLANPYPGVAQVRDACDPGSLDEFALAVFEAWRAAGEDPREGWALETCGKIGGERCARAVADRVRSWARVAEPPRYAWSQDEHRMVLVAGGGREFAFARSGCIVLAALAHQTGDALAATLLDDLARGGVQVWLRREAGRALGRPDEDGPHDDVEAPVPDVGLDENGTATLSTGPRTYRVSVDDALVPILEAADGERIASFPRQRKDDDPKAHAAAKERFAGIVKDAKIVARYQLALLERMMCSERTFRAEAFRERFLAHPFLRHAGRRVVWSARGATFRIAEDGTFADLDDARFELGDDPVGVVHPVTLPPAALETWKTRFADYQIVQPFRQLERELFRVRAEDIGVHEITLVAGATTSRGRLFQLVRRDWRVTYEDVVPGTSVYAKELRGGAHLRVTLTPAVTDGADADEPHTIVGATSSHSLDRIPAIDLSEAIRDLDYLRASR